jgi:hypothetical protein
MIKKLKRAKVTVKPTGSAKGGLRKLTFPITGGRVGVSEGKPVGVVKHRGSGFRMGKSTPKLFEFKSPTINLGTGIMAFQGPFGSPNLGKLFKSCFTFKEWVKPCPSHVVKLTRPGARLLRSLGLKVKPGAKFGFIQIPRIGEEVIVD